MHIPREYEALSPADIAKLLGVSVEGVKQALRRSKGLCRYCEALALPKLKVCAVHRTQKNAANRKRTGASSWKPGHRGRPPIKAK